MKKCFVALWMMVVCFAAISQDDPLLKSLVNELNRQKTAFAELTPAPYYFSFKVDELTSNSVRADFGGIVASDNDFGRLANVSVRIGDYEKDNTLVNRYDYRMDMTPLPIDDEEVGLTFMLWIMSDLKYKIAQASYNSLSSAQEGDSKGSFTKEDPESYYETPLSEEAFAFDKTYWEETLKDASALANNEPNFISANASISSRINRKYFLDSEEASVVQNHTNCILSLNVEIVDKTGNQIPISKTFSKPSIASLPDYDAIMEEMKELIQIAKGLVDADYVEPYSGPVLFSGSASAVFFHEVLGHRIEAERLTQITDGQTFVNKLETKILPKQLSVKSLPNTTMFRGMELTGNYLYDDQGVRSKDVTIIEEGVLKQFLMSRKPMGIFSQSNGHGRAAEGGTPTTRQSNLVVESSKGYSNEKLRERLIKECKKQGKEFGYYIDEVEGGYTTTDRYQPNTINISPLVVYKVFTDGREDEIVKGMNLTGTPLSAFSEIIATGTEYEVFNGYCGAESGYIPVSAVAPALLMSKMEVQRKPVNKTKLPILPAPSN